MDWRPEPGCRRLSGTRLRHQLRTWRPHPLKYELPIAIEENRVLPPVSETQPVVPGSVLAGLGASLLGVKWRFYNAAAGPLRRDCGGPGQHRLLRCFQLLGQRPKSGDRHSYGNVSGDHRHLTSYWKANREVRRDWVSCWAYRKLGRISIADQSRLRSLYPRSSRFLLCCIGHIPDRIALSQRR